MKIKLKGRVIEIGTSYMTEGILHPGAVIECNGQKLLFDLPHAQVQQFASHLFSDVTITITTEKPK